MREPNKQKHSRMSVKRLFQVEGMASTETPREEQTWCIRGATGGQGNCSRVSDRTVWGGEVGEAVKGHTMQAFLDHGEELRVLL